MLGVILPSLLGYLAGNGGCSYINGARGVRPESTWEAEAMRSRHLNRLVVTGPHVTLMDPDTRSDAAAFPPSTPISLHMSKLAGPSSAVRRPASTFALVPAWNEIA